MTARPWAAALSATTILEDPRGGRLPLLLWPAQDVDAGEEGLTRAALGALAARGVAATVTWDHALPDGVQRALDGSRRQADLGMPVCVNANALLHRFCDGSPETAHRSAGGAGFFDLSHDPHVRIGCPFALEHRIPEIRGRVERFLDAYRAAGLTVDFIFADWEIDGPMEWNGAWEAARRCTRCREGIPGIEGFPAFQDAVRAIRARLQRQAFSEPVLSAFPDALVGNYAVYPHGGERTWYDYYEKPVAIDAGADAVYRADGRARHRRWAREFSDTGYTMAMPVVYPWKPQYRWHDFANTDYHWVYGMLLAAGESAGTVTAEAAEAGAPAQARGRRLPLVPFVHRLPIDVPGCDAGETPPLSESAYRELLWHVLLRGHSTFFLWCPDADAGVESGPVQRVYAESLRYGEFIPGGTPLSFDVPREGPEGTVIRSALRAGGRVLRRETLFAPSGAVESRMEVATAP